MVWAGFQIVSSVGARHGRIKYQGGVAEVTNREGLKTYSIDEEGRRMPYGMYRLALKNGKILTIHKNNNGNVSVAEKGDLVIVRADENVIDVTLEEALPQ